MKEMKKKTALIIFISLLCFFNISAKKIFAQGTFGCRWIGGITKQCQVDPTLTNCQNGYIADKEACTKNNGTDENTCLGTENKHRCIQAPICAEGQPCYKNDCVCPQDQECRLSQNMSVPYCENIEPETNIKVLKPKPCGGCIDPLPDGSCRQYWGIQTALGCFPTQPEDIVRWLVKYSVIFSGGMGFLLMAYASFQMITSGGDPEKLKEAQSLFTSAIAGILLIVFSLFILRFIGYNILKLPGWE